MFGIGSMFGIDVEPDIAIRIIAFGFFLFLIGVWQQWRPARQRQPLNQSRLLTNFGLQGINASLYLLVPLSLANVSLFALFNQWGLFNAEMAASLALGLWTRIVISLIVLDISMYWLHRSYHRFSWLWRFHRVHHNDHELSMSTALRTHPIEMLINWSVRALVIFALGMPLIGVLLYEAIIVAMALLIHGNMRWGRVEDWLCWFMVTPKVHARHHYADAFSNPRNFGLVLTLWDRLFGTYARPESDNDLVARVKDHRNQLDGPTLPTQLLAPFRKTANLAVGK